MRLARIKLIMVTMTSAKTLTLQAEKGRGIGIIAQHRLKAGLFPTRDQSLDVPADEVGLNRAQSRREKLV